MSWFFFFFQAEDGIRDVAVTGVQTCALPISSERDRLDAGRSCTERLAEGLQLPSRLQPRAADPLSTTFLRESLEAFVAQKSDPGRRSTGPPRLRRSSSTLGRWIQNALMSQ